MQNLSGAYAGIAVQILFALLAPAALYLYFRNRQGCKGLPFWKGCLGTLIFVLLLEQNAHSLILSTPFGKKIQASPWLLAIYGGLMAALFEETGRVIAFTLMRKKNELDDRNALMYGAGHGGFEAFAVLGLAAVSNLTCVFVAKSNPGTTDPTQLMAIAQAEALAATPLFTFLLAILERCFAICIQIVLSVLVWFGVQRKKPQLIALAFALHFVVDAISALLGAVCPVLLVELAVCVMAALSALLARKVWKKYHDDGRTAQAAD